MDNKIQNAISCCIDLGEGSPLKIIIYYSTESQIKDLYDKYNKEYYAGEFLASFEEYLQEKGILYNLIDDDYDLYL